MVEWVAVDGSSSISAIAYDIDLQRINIRYQTGRAYWYGDCSVEVWEALNVSASKGQFVNQELRRRSYGTLEE
jgi:hypothetical protein